MRCWMRWIRASTAGLVSALVGVCVPAQAHDLSGLVHDYSTSDRPEFKASDLPESLKSFNRAYVAAGDQATRAVLVNAFVWPVPSKLTVCFDRGPASLRPKIAAAMREWSALSEGNITFVFDEAAASNFKECDRTTRYQIRIGFVKGGGHWSQIGTLSETVFPNNSMNLDFDKDPMPDDWTVKGITLHETGHALGLHHEHQSPASPCTGWNWDRILEAYNWPGNTKAEREAAMRFNLERLSDDVLATGQHTYTFTAYDQASIMHYSFPVSMFRPGQDQCRVDERHELSAADKEAMKDAYTRQRDPGDRSRNIDTALANPRLDGSVRDLLTKQKQLYPDR
jgi:hypothetical protein